MPYTYIDDMYSRLDLDSDLILTHTIYAQCNIGYLGYNRWQSKISSSSSWRVKSIKRNAITSQSNQLVVRKHLAN